MSQHKILVLLGKTSKITGNVLVKLFKKSRLPIAIFMIIFAIIFSIFRALTPWVKQYKHDVEKHLSLLLNQPVKINDLETSWYWFQPVLKMNQVTVSDLQHHKLEFNQLLVGINLFSSLWHWNIQPGVLYVDDVHLIIRQTHNHWDIEGLGKNNDQELKNSSSLPMMAWLLAQNRIVLKNVSADLCLDNGKHMNLTGINFSATHSYGGHHINVRATLAQKIPTYISIMADLQLDSSTIKDTSGHVYISIQNFVPSQWQKLIPIGDYRVKHGNGNLEAWLDIDHGHVVAAQSIVQAEHVVWLQDGSSTKHAIDHLQANVAWKNNEEGWQLATDHVQLKLGGVSWPENSALFEFKKSDHAYHAFVKTVLLQPLLAIDLPWPDYVQSLLTMHPEGELSDTQLVFKNDQLVSILTRFQHLGWQAHDSIPGVKELSGVLYWQPKEGRLDLDGENTTIEPKNLPALAFRLFNISLDWKELSHGLRVSMDRLVLSHPDLLLSAQGVLDNPNQPELRTLNMSGEFYAKNAEKFLLYIPANLLKDKLDKWLKHDLKHIEKASGRFVVKGKLDDFPFDKNEGKFAINAHVSGVDLLVNSEWPLNKNMEANINVNKREFVADVTRVTLLNEALDHVNLVIPDIGLGQEALLLHANIKVLASKIKEYIFASPLRENLALLKYADVQNEVGLDLQLDIPLYPERDHVAANGFVTFDNNIAKVHGLLHDLTIDKLSGQLHFNEYRITDGDLLGSVNGEPLSMQSQSISTPIPHTDVQLQGTTTLNELKTLFNSPLLSLMTGHLKVNGSMTLFDSNQGTDQIQLDTNLEGVTINLPLPLGKAAGDLTPLNLDLFLNANHMIELKGKYSNILNSDILFDNSKGQLVKGQFLFGSKPATLPRSSGLQVAGVIPVVDVAEWQRALSPLFKDQESSSLMSELKNIDLKIGNVIAWQNTYPDVQIKTKVLTADSWSINVQQQNLAADLQYQWKSNELSGHFSRLFLPEFDVRKSTKPKSKKPFSPKELPKLNFIVDDLKIGEVHAGSAVLKTSSTPTEWILEECKVESPDYSLRLSGHWVDQRSSVEAALRIDDLSKSLARWNMTPAVSARSGVIDFRGQWPGSFSDFSLRHTTGDMKIVLKNGRISQLSRETEAKLGLGKLLSILSLQTIPRRLQLDFSDLSEQGYSFDIFKGNFNLHKGVMHTEDSYIDGPVAYASMKGDLDLTNRVYDLDLRVTPYIAASLPIIVTIAGGPVAGPVAGLATWVASKIINKGMQQISGYTYKISGPWSDPVVQQVSIDRKKSLKAPLKSS